jgi:uncharacterized membrane protein YphA (DoxX/SURF4 family)
MASILVYAFYCYLCIGVVFALWFTIKGVDKIDEGMHGAPKGVRILIFPGAVLLWIVLSIKYLRKK